MVPAAGGLLGWPPVEMEEQAEKVALQTGLEVAPEEMLEMLVV